MLWWVTNGRAAAPAGDRLHRRASRPRRTPARPCTVRNAAMIFDRPRKRRSDSGLLNRSTYRCRYRCSRSVRPCHFSGGGSRLLPRNVSAVGEDGQLAGLGAAERAVDADQVAEVELGGERPAGLADLVLADEDLDPARSSRGAGGS